MRPSRCAPDKLGLNLLYKTFTPPLQYAERTVWQPLLRVLVQGQLLEAEVAWFSPGTLEAPHKSWLLQELCKTMEEAGSHLHYAFDILTSRLLDFGNGTRFLDHVEPQEL